MIPEAAVPMIARNAAWLATVTRFPNSDLVRSEDFIRAIDTILEAAAPHMLAGVTTEAVCVSNFHNPPKQATVRGTYANGQDVWYCGTCATVGESVGMFKPVTR